MAVLKVDSLDALSIVNVFDDHEVADAEAVILAEGNRLIALDKEVKKLVLSAADLGLGYTKK